MQSGLSAGLIRPRKPALVVNGGDIAVGDSTVMGTLGQLNRASWFDYLAVASGGMLRWRKNAGVSGNTSAQVLARLDADVLSLHPARVFVLVGINDAAVSPAQTPERETLNNYRAIAGKIIGAGAQPIFLTPLPSLNTFRTNYERLQAWLLNYCDANGILCVDTHAAVTNPIMTGVGDWQSALSADGTHPNNAGAKAVGLAVLAMLNQQPNRRLPYLSTVDLDSVNLLTNSLFTTDTNSDGTPDGWVNSGGTGNTFTIPADSLGHGNLLTLDRGGSSSTVCDIFSTTLVQGGQPAAGDRIALSFRLKTTLVAGTGVFRFSINNTLGGVFYPLFDQTEDFDTIVYLEFLAGTAASSFDLAIRSGTGTVQIGQLTALNLTALGFAA